jgi:hypothetical protein
VELSTGHPKEWGQPVWEPCSPRAWTAIVQMARPLTRQQQRQLPPDYRCGDHAPNYVWVPAAAQGTAADAVGAALAAVLAITGPETCEQYCVSLTARRALREPASHHPASLA